MSNAVIAVEKTEEVKKGIDSVSVMDVAISRDNRFVSAYPETGTEVLGGRDI